MNRKELAKEIWRSFDIMRRDDGTTGIMEYTIQISWMLFLRLFESMEDRYELESKLSDKKYDRIIDGKFRWSEWTKIGPKNNEIIRFTNDQVTDGIEQVIEEIKNKIEALKLTHKRTHQK